MAQEIVDAVAKPLIESAAPATEAAGGAVVGTVVGVGGLLLGSSPQLNAGEDQIMRENNALAQKQEAEHSPEPQASTSGAGARKGGGANKKSTTPVGQSSSGQKINAYGEKLGGSGRPQRHSEQHSTRKAAKDAARQEGKTAPTQDNGHFHATDREGNKVHNGTHHKFPD